MGRGKGREKVKQSIKELCMKKSKGRDDTRETYGRVGGKTCPRAKQTLLVSGIPLPLPSVCHCILRAIISYHIGNKNE